MKRCFFSILLLLVGTLFVTAKERGETFVHRLLPDYVALQYAGSIGAGSLGTGWYYGRKKQWESEFNLGIVPKGAYDQAMTVIALKQSYIPWDIKVYKSDFFVSPLTCGIFISSVLDGHFWGKEPDKYHPPYYGFSTKLRLNFYIGQRLSYRPKHHVLSINSISPYYGLSMSDLNIINAIHNSYLKVGDLLKIAVGVKFYFK